MLFEHTGGMFPELVTRTDLSVFLPPIGGCTAYIMGDPDSIPDPSKPLVVRLHDDGRATWQGLRKATMKNLLEKKRKKKDGE